LLSRCPLNFSGLRGGFALRQLNRWAFPDFGKLKESCEKTGNNYWRRGMSISALATDERVAEVETTEDELSVRLMDGRTIRADKD
jgi:hypothetical protein